jgi:phosphoglycerol transferase MdoB-like AlkP superfamily enzyme
VTTTRLLAAAYVIVALGAVIGLWHFWTPRCTETCARWIVLSMYATFLVVPVAALGIALSTLWGRLGRNASLVVFGVCALCLLLWSGFVTHSAAP